MKGLTLIGNAITEQQQEEIVAFLDTQEWDNRYKRLTQYFGYDYEYRSRGLKKIGDGSIPSILLPKRLLDEIKPEAIIVNEYHDGQSISKHVDANCWGNRIVILSLLTDTVMDLSYGIIEKQIKLPARSLLIMEDDVRYKIQHGINHKGDRRISLTYRTINPNILHTL